jgi:hypothetical protein
LSDKTCCVVEQSDGVTDRVMEVVKESNAS